MKNLYLRSMLAAACAVTLAACGGSGGNLYLQVSVSDLAKDGLILQNDGERLPVTAGQTNVAFTKLVKTDDRYNITIAEQPKGAVCTIINGVGKASSYSVTTAVVSCKTNTYPLTGTITGLTAGNLRLVMGSTGITLSAGATAYTFESVADGAPYGISILAQPTGLTCRFQGSKSADASDTVGTMGSAATTAATLDCTPQ
ncbi:MULTISPECIES: hypothetical protein [unclassified Janthinobacterium]|uniref:hypothetical protein n=1 Tax=unclassified Janthinobacterium TaxID=2610881 RepID=UPI0025B05196|nr:MULTISPECIES: hypothetical protein [unclassified Janthinobacterium]MDN2716684.1 hypothetical protein [Janthinobacterium sp. SUN120]MDO8038888.1 hypothetical protein [Janthinobacterium sp. SUN137]MDO8052170.1 hypothetical protein [Janthinobacterium sp. SUN211]